MEVPITQFRQKLFELVDQALEGKEVWVKHKGRRVRIVPEHAHSKLNRITPMQIIPPGIDIEDDSWKAEMMRDWEEDWDRQLGVGPKSARSQTASARGKAHKTQRRS